MSYAGDPGCGGICTATTQLGPDPFPYSRMKLNLDFDRLELGLTDTQAHFPVNKAHETDLLGG
jgi:hypothetical protein